MRYIVSLEFNMGLPSPTLLETFMHPTQLKLTRRILGIAAELAAAQKVDLARWEKPIKATGVQLD